MSFGAMLCVIAATGLIAAYLAWRVEWISSSRWFRWGGLALIVALLVLMRLCIRNLHPADVLLIVFACLCWAPFVAYFMMHGIVGLARSAVSLDNIKVPPSYSQAEGAAAQKDYSRAILLYHQAAQEHPAEPEPYRRMGEMFLMLNQPDDAIAAFQDAQQRQKDPGDQLPMAFRISEVLVENKNDLRGAIRIIEEFLARHPEVEGRAFAQERLRNLRSRAPEGTSAERQKSQ